MLDNIIGDADVYRFIRQRVFLTFQHCCSRKMGIAFDSRIRIDPVNFAE